MSQVPVFQSGLLAQSLVSISGHAGRDGCGAISFIQAISLKDVIVPPL
jgi:hypothetical protein